MLGYRLLNDARSINSARGMIIRVWYVVKGENDIEHTQIKSRKRVGF